MIRRYRPADLAPMHAIEMRATKLLAAHGYPSLADELPATLADFRRFVEENETWIAAARANDVAVGFAVAGGISDYLHLMELAVDPAYGRRGLGSALLGAVIRHAAEQRYAGVTLSTFRDVPFNAPFYASHGFGEFERGSAPAELVDRFIAEVPVGIDPACRLLMKFVPSAP